VTRTQILLEEDQHAFLKEYAERVGLSLSEVVRRAVEELRARVDTPEERLLACLGAHRADRPDVSVGHDAAVADAFGARR
jgi:hypothetical protein